MSATAIPFLQPDDQGHFHVNPRAAEILSQITTKVVVVAVAGPYRTGKSYLLNRLIGNVNGGKGFSVGNTVNACTKGIWLWGAPVYDSKSKTTYVYLDTEGLNSTGEEVTFDTQIFALSVLLSSAFVLNTQNNITESALEQLELVAECSKSISFKPPTAEQEAFARELADARERGEYVDIEDVTIDPELALHFPSLTWVLRDFGLKLLDKDGQPITPNEYLENQLKPLPENKRGAAEKNRIRRCIKSCFLRRECVPLVRPVADEDQLQLLDSLPTSALRPEFERGIAHLRRQIAQSDVKMINGKPVTGQMLVGLAEEYTDAMNTGRMPSILSAWQAVLEVRVAEEATAGTRTVTDGLEQFGSTVVEEAVLRRAYEGALEGVAARARTVFVGDNEAAERVAAAVRERCEKSFENALRRNAAMSKDFCRNVFASAWEDPTHPLNQKQFLRACSEGGAEEVLAFVDEMKAHYDAHAAGPHKEAVRADVVGKLLRMALESMQERVHEALAECDRAEAENAELKEQVADAREEAQEHKAALSSVRGELLERKHELELLRTKLEQAQRDEARAAHEARKYEAEASQLRREVSDSAATRALLERRCVELEAAVKQAAAELQREQSHGEKTERELSNRQSELADAREALSKAKDALAREQEAVMRERERAKEVELQCKAAAREHDVAQRENSRLQAELRKVAEEHHQAVRENKSLQKQLDESASSHGDAVRAAREQLREAKEQLREAKDSASLLRKQLQAQVEALEDDKITLQARVKAAEREVAEAKESGVVASSALDTLRQQVRALEGKVQGLHNDIENRDRDIERLRREQASAELRRELERERLDKMELARQVETLRRELAAERDAAVSTPAAKRRHSGAARSALEESMVSLGMNEPLDSSFFSPARESVASPAPAPVPTAARRVTTKPAAATPPSASAVYSDSDTMGNDTDSDVDGWENPTVGLGQASPMRKPDMERIMARRRANGSAIGLESLREDAQKRSHARYVDPAFRAAALESHGLAPPAKTASKSSAPAAARVPPGAEPVRDPTKLTVVQLKSWLTSLDVLPDPNKKYKKQDYIDLLRKHDPRL